MLPRRDARPHRTEREGEGIELEAREREKAEAKRHEREEWWLIFFKTRTN
jgi:hypothetical protein